jgi:hypothetical protein
MEDQLHINRQMISQVLHGDLVTKTTMWAEFVARSNSTELQLVKTLSHRGGGDQPPVSPDLVVTDVSILSWVLALKDRRFRDIGGRQVELDVKIEWIFLTLLLCV